MDIYDPFSTLDTRTRKMLQDMQEMNAHVSGSLSLVYAAQDAHRLSATGQVTDMIRALGLSDDSLTAASDHAARYAELAETISGTNGLSDHGLSAMDRCREEAHKYGGIVIAAAESVAMQETTDAALAGLNHFADSSDLIEKCAASLGLEDHLRKNYSGLASSIPDWLREAGGVASSAFEAATESMLKNMTGMSSMEELYKHQAELMGLTDCGNIGAMMEAASALVINEPNYVSHLIDENDETEPHHSPGVVDASAHLEISSSLTASQRVFVALPQQQQREIIKFYLAVFTAILTLAALGFNVYAHFNGHEVKQIHRPVDDRRLAPNTGYLPLEPETEVTHHLRAITGTGVRLREGPSTATGILKQSLPPGLVVTVLAKRGSWLKVEYSIRDGDKTRGWVFAEHAEPIQTLH